MFNLHIFDNIENTYKCDDEENEDPHEPLYENDKIIYILNNKKFNYKVLNSENIIIFLTPATFNCRFKELLLELIEINFDLNKIKQDRGNYTIIIFS